MTSRKTKYASAPLQVLTVLACLLIIKTTLSVLLSYRDYMPPNFESEFLRGRERYFSGSYSWAFYTHITSGPCSLILGMILVSEPFRRRFTRWHRNLGRTQIANVLLLVSPSGLWMAYYARTGTVAGLGFGSLAVATGLCAALGWRSAVKKRFAQHRRWMWRCFLLLCSAIVLRLIGGVAILAEVEAAWPYQLAAWTSWLVPLTVFEVVQLGKQ